MVITVLGISGSPHRHGNTETLLDSFLDGAKAAGAKSRKWCSRISTIRPAGDAMPAIRPANAW